MNDSNCIRPNGLLRRSRIGLSFLLLGPRRSLKKKAKRMRNWVVGKTA